MSVPKGDWAATVQSMRTPHQYHPLRVDVGMVVGGGRTSGRDLLHRDQSCWMVMLSRHQRLGCISWWYRHFDLSV